MPVCRIASLPSLNRLVSKSGVPCPCSIVGIMVPLLPTSQSAASMPSGVLNATSVPSVVEELAAVLRQHLVELVEAHRLVVAPDARGLVGELLGRGLLVGPGPVGGRVGDAGRVEEVLVVEQHDGGERLGSPYCLPSVW